MSRKQVKIVSISKTFPSYIYGGTVLAFIYVVIFITLYFYLDNQIITLQSLVEVHLQHPFLFFIELLPVIVFFGLNSLINDISNRVYEIEQELALLNSKNRAIYNFIEQLRRGNTDVDFSSEFMQDRLIMSLVNLRDELKRSREEEMQRKKEDEQRHWINEGLAKFSAILREYVDNLDRLAEEITSNLTRYLDAKQAAFFVVKEEGAEKYLEMIAFFAYDRKKFPDKKLLWGEGLIGAAAIEKKIIVLNEVTEDFVEITSGLGGARPRAIIIAPLVDDEEEVHGVLEMASFKPFEDYQVSFIEQIARSIADTIANIKRNLRTQELLKASQEQAERLSQQEEKMRRSMEELKMLQLEAAKQSEEFVSFTNSVNKALLRAEFTKEGFLVYANDNFLKLLGYSDYFEVINKHITMFLAESDRGIFDSFWPSFISEDKVYDADIRFVTRHGEEKWVSSAFIGIKNKEGSTIKILFLGLDRTEEKILQFEYISEIKFVNNVILKAEFSAEGYLVDANNLFLNLVGYTRDDILNKHYSEVLNFSDIEDFDVVWRNILSGRTHSSVHRLVTSFDTEVWVEGFYSAIIINKKVRKVVFYAIDITVRKHLEKQLAEKEELLRQKDEILEKQAEAFEQEKQQLLSKFSQVDVFKNLFELTLENLDRAVVSIDETEHIVLFNSYAEELWGLKREVVLGKRLTSILPELPQTYEDDLEYLLVYFNTKEPLVGQSKLSYIVDKSGKRKNVQYFAVQSEYENKKLLTAFIKIMEF